MLKKIKNKSIIFLSILFVSLLFARSGFAATLSFSPSSTTFSSGDTGFIEVILDTEGQSVVGAAGNIKIDGTAISITKIENGSGVDQSALAQAEINDGNLYFEIFDVSLNGNVPLVKLFYNAQSEGNTSLSFQNVADIDSFEPTSVAGAPAQSGGASPELLASAGAGSANYTVGPAGNTFSDTSNDFDSNTDPDFNDFDSNSNDVIDTSSNVTKGGLTTKGGVPITGAEDYILPILLLFGSITITSLVLRRMANNV